MGADVGAALVQFAHEQNATQIVLGASRQSRWTHLVRGSVINDVIRASGPIDVHVISSVADALPTERVHVRRPVVSVSRRRRVLAWTLAIVGPPVVTLVLAQMRDALALPSDLLLLPARRRHRRRTGRVRTRDRVRSQRVPVRQLLLHAAVSPVHGRRR